MIRRASVLVIVIGFLLTMAAAVAQAEDPTGETTRNRLPWRATTGQRTLTQGWDSGGSHDDKFAADFANNSGGGPAVSFRANVSHPRSGASPIIETERARPGRRVIIDSFRVKRSQPTPSNGWV